jgi:nicotinamide riboside kinase
MAEGINLSVGIETNQTQLDNLKEYMQDWITEHESREIIPTVGIHSNQIYDSRRLDITVVLAHKTQWQNGGARVARRTRFMLKLAEGLIACGIVLVVKPIDLAAAH